MKIVQGVQGGVAGAGGGSSTSIPYSVVGAWGEMIGSSTDAITPDATTGKKLVYIKLIRTATGDGDLIGNGSGGVAMFIVDDVVSVTDGTNIATVTVTDFAAVDDQIILVVELTDTTMRIGQVLDLGDLYVDGDRWLIDGETFYIH